jgi:hypothetical protein
MVDAGNGAPSGSRQKQTRWDFASVDPRMPTTRCPSRRIASTWTGPMNLVPATAAPIGRMERLSLSKLSRFPVDLTIN